MEASSTLGFVAIALVGLGSFAAVYLVVSDPPQVAVPKLGLRGLKRREAMGGTFALIEPLVRVVAAVIAMLPIDTIRRRAAHQLRLAGDFLGLSANEYIALSVVTAGLGASVGLGFMLAKPEWYFVPACAFLGAIAPYGRVSDVVGTRARAVNSALPGGIELMALCMGAGLDFPGAIRQLVDTAPDRRHPLYEELERILQELELGRTRERVLATFAERIPTPQVRDFVSAVIQAERKGTPLAEVLRVQANLQRKAKSNRIEENASKAAVKMTMPMLLLLGATMILLLAPPILKYVGEF